MIKIKHHFFYSFVFLFSCSSGGGSSDLIPQQPEIIINNSSLPELIFSFQRINLEISSNYPSCNYSLDDSDIHWITSSGNSFAFNAPITTLEEEDFKFVISSISSGNCPSGTKEINLKVKKSNSKFDAIPINNLELKTQHYHISDIGFGGLELQDRYSASICYPTPNDCMTYENQLFGQDAHNMATGDFNGDGFEDLAVMWAIFPHTIEESQKINAPLQIYLNDGGGHLYEGVSLFSNSEFPTHPFGYRLAIEDYNADGIDDIFVGSMGKQVRGENSTQDYIKPYPHLLILSNQNGTFDNRSSNINDQNNGLGPLCSFAHDASSGDFDGDGDKDIFACNMLLVNNGFGAFEIHPFIGFDWYSDHMSPMSSLLTDINNDGYDDILFWNFDNRPLSNSKLDEGTILLSNNTSNIEAWQEINLPKGPFPANRNKYNHAVSGDLNSDGYKDVVVSITRDDPYYEGAYIQILINDQNGSLIDQTTSRFNNQSRFEKHHGEGNIYLRDLDKDGDLDIVHSTRDFISDISGAHLAINDGQGNFISNESLLPERPISFTNSTTSLMKGVPIDLDKQGCLDLISTSDSWSDEKNTRNYLFSIINIDCSF